MLKNINLHFSGRFHLKEIAVVGAAAENTMAFPEEMAAKMMDAQKYYILLPLRVRHLSCHFLGEDSYIRQIYIS